MASHYGANDPRSTLTKDADAGLALPVRDCGYGRFFDQTPQLIEADGAKTWFIRSANAIVAITQACAGTILSRRAHPDEYILLCGSECAATCSTEDGDSLEASAESVTIIPPGQSAIACHTAGYYVRCFTTRSADLVRLAQNGDAYRDGAPEVAPLVDWPAPPGGFRLRNYRLPDMERITFAHIIRSSNLMVSTPMRSSVRRDPRAMSPHHHGDFEQMSIVLEGSWVHHLRKPWTPDMTQWREDEHATFASPSVLVVPAGMIHTSQDVGSGQAWIIDLFSPPRADFSRQEGWVLNAADYPAPWEYPA